MANPVAIPDCLGPPARFCARGACACPQCLSTPASNFSNGGLRQGRQPHFLFKELVDLILRKCPGTPHSSPSPGAPNGRARAAPQQLARGVDGRIGQRTWRNGRRSGLKTRGRPDRCIPPRPNPVRLIRFLPRHSALPYTSVPGSLGAFGGKSGGKAQMDVVHLADPRAVAQDYDLGVRGSAPLGRANYFNS